MTLEVSEFEKEPIKYDCTLAASSIKSLIMSISKSSNFSFPSEQHADNNYALKAENKTFINLQDMHAF